MPNNFVYDIRAVLNIRGRINSGGEFEVLPLANSDITDFSKFRTGYVDISSVGNSEDIKKHVIYDKDELDDVFESCPVSGGVTFCSSGDIITVGFDCLHAKDILIGGRSEEFVLDECAKLICWLKEKQKEFEKL